MGPPEKLSESTFKSINSLLEVHSKERLFSLRREFPSFSELFEPSFKLGSSNDTVDSETGDPRIADAIRALAINGLEIAQERIPLMIGALSRRLRLTRAMKLSAGVVATVSNAGVISALAFSSRATAIATACLGLASSLTALVGEHFEKPFGGGDQKGLSAYLQQMLDAEKNAKELALRLAAGGIDVLEIAREVNGLASNIRAVEVYSGIRN